jgi:hypothetical protein|tara:strand:+ start:90 stop:617 length:528 start_codon:yes stop_codon:yes gene_type:complete
MECPACTTNLTQVQVGDIQVDICKGGCGGVWFDTYEFKKFDEPHEEAGTALLDIPINESISINHDERRNCPKCSSITLMRNFFSVKKEVEIDTCAKCAGVWLDSGELNSIRSQFASEEERKKAAEVVFNEVFGPELDRLRKESDEKLNKARRFANMVRFICPSKYIPGKQDWGAF